jgi:chromosome partitioning protein
MIVTVYATKSSTKTSIAVSTAVHLANQGKDVLMADLDTQASASSWLEFRSEDENLKQIPCIQKYGKTVSKDLKELDTRYEIVVADCGGKNDTSDRSALLVSDIAIIPIIPSSLSLSLLTLEASLDACFEAKLLNDKLKVFIVLSGCSSHHLVKDTDESKEFVAEALAEYNEENVALVDSTITARKIWMDIVSVGKGITESGHAKSISEFELLMKEVFHGDH